MTDKRDIRFFPVFLGATLGVLLEIIATLIDEIITGNLFISEYVIVAVNDSIGKNSSRSMDRAIKTFLRAALIEGAALVGLILLGSGAFPEFFDIDNPDTARLANTMLMILAPSALFICLTRVTAIFYQYTRRIPRTIVLFGMAIALLPSAFAMLFGRIAPEGIAVGIALGPVAALALMYGYVRLIKKEKLLDYALMKPYNHQY